MITKDLQKRLIEDNNIRLQEGIPFQRNIDETNNRLLVLDNRSRETIRTFKAPGPDGI